MGRELSVADYLPTVGAKQVRVAVLEALLWAFHNAKSGLPEFWGEVQPPASLKGLDIPSRRAVFVPWKPSRRRGFVMGNRLFVEEPMLSTGLHLASESSRPSHVQKQRAVSPIPDAPKALSEADAGSATSASSR